jgi:hypothetical protein
MPTCWHTSLLAYLLPILHANILTGYSAYIPSVSKHSYKPPYLHTSIRTYLYAFSSVCSHMGIALVRFIPSITQCVHTHTLAYTCTTPFFPYNLNTSLPMGRHMYLRVGTPVSHLPPSQKRRRVSITPVLVHAFHISHTSIPIRRRVRTHA